MPHDLAQVDFLADAVDAVVLVLGICFGGQALAAALRHVVRGPRGDRLGRDADVRARAVSAGPWLHFNSERFSVPEGATLVASLGDRPSAFRYGTISGCSSTPRRC